METSDEDDLNAPRLKRGTKRNRSPAKQRLHIIPSDTGDVTTTSSSDIANDISVHGNNELVRKRNHQTITAPERIEDLDDEGTNTGEAAYKRFKERKTQVRKKAAASARKAKAIEAENNPLPGTRSAGTTGVGKQSQKKKRIRTKAYDEESSDDNLMEWTMPDYIKDRRSRFDERKERLKEGGLQLPPEYGDVYFSDDERLQDLRERPDFPRTKVSAPYKDIDLPYSLGIIPAPIAQFLREYQVKGVGFLHEMFVYQRGGILGDDMGLGKTVQVIAFLTAAYGKTGDERDKKRMRKMRHAEKAYPRVLIICPGSLMANWQDELRRWGWWHSEIYHGLAHQREEVLKTAQAGRLEIMITTYSTYRLNKGAINMVQWDCVIADECHIIKERKSEITKSMNEINALCRIGLTGTAIQNKYEELWTLLNWTNPGRFGPMSTWRASICEPLKLGQSHNATQYQLARARKTARKLVENLLPQFFLRRMKTLIQDQLPKKSDRVVFCPLTETQASAYQNFLDSDIVQTIKNSSEMCDCGSGRKQGWCCHMFLEDGSKWQNWVFPAIANLQKLSNHLALLIPQGNDPQEKQAKDIDMLQIACPSQWKALYNSRDSLINYANPEFCGKWRVLQKLLHFWHSEEGNKVLVFSHSVRLLKMLKSLFISTSYNVSYLDGSMSYEERFATVQEFNTDPTQFVFLISTKAGGVGLNITSANKVVVVDPNWNPSYDLQAQDRAYRIGQTRDVEVFRLVSSGTLEEVVYARQIYKQQQASIGYNASYERRYFQGVQGRKDEKGEIFGLRNLFAFQNENIVLRDIVNKTNVAESRVGVQVTALEIEEQDQEAGLDNDGTVKDEEDLPRKSFKSEPDTEDAAMSQLAAEITGDTDRPRTRRKATGNLADKTTATKRHDPIQAILSSVGVSYTHENSEVIGSSRVEARLSKRAEGASEFSTQHQQSKVFLDESQSQARNIFEDPSSRVQYVYRPPEDVKKRQFCSMARWAGHGDDVVEFALLVENWTQAQRRGCLERFYKWRLNVLDEVLDIKDGVKEETKDEHGAHEDSKDDIKTEIKHEIKHEINAGGRVGTMDEIELESDDEL